MKTYILLGLCCGLSIFCLGQSITNIEYYFNTDPGLGNGTTITANANSGDITQSLNIAVPTDVVGFNTLFIRTQDNNGVWSMYDKAIFFITDFNPAATSDELVAAEYYFNTDPGIGNATAISLNANSGTIDQTLLLALPTDMEGFNSIYIRVLDDLGVWSLYDTAKFYVTNFETSGGATEITALEYFFDTDPGLGNANPLTVNTNSGDLEQALNIPLDELSVGFHKLYLRVQDDSDVWSLYDKKLFYVKEDNTILEIVAAEYFYDTDPGIGNGTPTTITPTGNPDEFTIDLATTDVSCDFHDFYIRLQNADGTWSLYDHRKDVEVYDNADPTIVVFEDITVALDENGQGSITIDDVNNGTYDDCELVSVVMTPETASYDCNNLGENTVTITATDAENKVSTLDVTITVIDNIDPVAIGQNITVQLDSNGDATITGTQVDNGSTDNCTIANRTLDINSFTCDDLGDNDVILTVTDQSGNSNTTTVTVTVEDNIAPSLTTQNITVELGADGTVTLDPFEPVADSGDNCTLDIFLENDFFTCDDLGDNIITVTAEDGSGNSTDGSATITVVDNLDPVAIGQNITIQLDSNGDATITANQIDNGSTDNCTIASRTLDINSFTCDDLGDNDVILTVTDQSGNSNTTTVTVTVEDNIVPSLTTQNITVELGADGTVTIDSFEPVADSGDNCTLDIFLENDFFTCDDLGDNIITVTAEDGSGNSTDGSATITVVDNLDPVAIGQNITIQLDSNGDATITANQIDNGSTDNCTVANRTLNITSFTCDDLGDNDIILTVTDQSGNSNTTTVTVTVEDVILPNALGQDITIDLAGANSISITASDVDNGSNDNCTFSLAIDQDTFTEAGEYPVVLTITDSSGNSNSVTVTVTVIDSTLSISSFETDIKNIKLYPVPAKNLLNIKTDLTIDKITLFDVSGKELNVITKTNKQINVTNLPSGVYFIKIMANNTFVTKRFIKE